MAAASVAVAVGAAWTSPARAQTDVAPEDVAVIARTLNCPICQGYNLQDCPLTVCADMRETIRQRLALGQTRQQIVDAFVADYGPQVLNAPPRRGFLATAWIVPPLAVAIIVLLAAGALGGQRRRAMPPEALPKDGPAEADLAVLAELERVAGELDR